MLSRLFLKFSPAYRRLANHPDILDLDRQELQRVLSRHGARIADVWKVSLDSQIREGRWTCVMEVDAGGNSTRVVSPLGYDRKGREAGITRTAQVLGFPVFTTPFGYLDRIVAVNPKKYFIGESNVWGGSPVTILRLNEPGSKESVYVCETVKEAIFRFEKAAGDSVVARTLYPGLER